MPTTPLTSDQYDIVLSGGYRASEYLIVCPSTVIFAARVNGTPVLDVFASFVYDTVTVGAFGDIKEGQTILISRTNDKRAAFFRGRIRKPAISGTIYINETSDAIQDNDYVFVVNTYDIAEKLRKWPFVDWDVDFHKIPPMVKDMQSAYAVLTTAATAEFSFAPVGQALAKSATIASYAWVIPGATYTVGSASTQNITITVNTPYNEWGRLTITDSNGVSNWFVFTISAGNPNNPAHTFFRLCHDPVDYSADLDNGYSASVEYWRGVDDLIDRTRVAIVVDERYNDGDAELGNIRFVGYFIEDTGDVRGDERYSQLQNASISLSGFIQLAGELPFNAIFIAHDTTPTEWDAIDTPTPVRCAAHIILEHSTLGNLAPIDWGVIDDTYFMGNADIGETSLIDAAQTVAGKINASFTQDGGGQLVFRRNANFQTTAERNALDTVTPDPITLGEGMSFSLKHVHKRRVGAVTVSFIVYTALTNAHTFITARAPANGSGEGAEQIDIQEQLLAPQSDIQDALDEAAQRAGDWLEYKNPVDILTVNIDDGFGFISPSNDQWYTFDIPAANLPRGVAISTTDRWLCVSIAPKLNDRGGRDVQAVFRKESRGGRANIFVAVVPEVTDTALAVLPAFPSYGGMWSPEPSINYDTTDPTDLQPFDPFDMGQTLPLPAEQGAGQGSGMAQPGCYVQSPPISFKNSSNVQTNFVTTLSAPYTITLKGFAQISNDAWIEVFDLESALGDFTVGVGTWTGGVGVTPADVIASGPSGIRAVQINTTIASTTITSVTVTFDITKGTYGTVVPAAVIYLTSGIVASIDSATITNGNDKTLVWSGSEASTDIILQVTTSYDAVLPYAYSGATTLTRVVVTGVGTNPFTMDPGTPLYADAFYTWELDDEGEIINVQLNSTGGLYLDNAAVSVPPPFNPNHEYTIPFLGTGNVLLSRWHTGDYSSVQNVLLYLTICGPSAGS